MQGCLNILFPILESVEIIYGSTIRDSEIFVNKEDACFYSARRELFDFLIWTFILIKNIVKIVQNKMHVCDGVLKEWDFQAMLRNTRMIFEGVKMLKYIKGFFMLSLLLLMASQVFAEKADVENAMKALILASKARAAIVKKVQDAVVHIEVEMMPQGQRFGNQEPSENELFDRFFRQRPNSPDAPRRFRPEGMGSGTILEKNGYILTNNHVVGSAEKILVMLSDGREMEAKLVGSDPPSDLAVIKIDGGDLPVLPFGNSDLMDVGESVIAIGNPFGLSQTVTFGIISGKGRSNIGITDYEDFIQTDAAINPGNSGGPLINLNGEIIGVNTAIFTRSGSYQGVGFAVPINMARQIMEDLIKKGSVSRGWLGVGIQDIDGRLAKAFGLENTNGSLITMVFKNTPAGKAGIQKGDVVIALNGKPIRNSAQFRNMVAVARANTIVEIEIFRKGKTETIKVKLEERPKDPLMAQRQPEEESFLGITVEELTEKTAEQYGFEPGTGVLITKIEPQSPADKSSLKVGTLIVEVDRQAISNAESFKAAIKAADIEEGVLLLIQNQQGSQYIIISEK